MEPFHQFPDLYLVIAAVLYMFAQALQMGTGAARLAGVRTKRVATGLTLFNLFATTGRLLSLFYAPLLSSLTDHARNTHDVAGLPETLVASARAAAIERGLDGFYVPYSDANAAVVLRDARDRSLRSVRTRSGPAG